MPLTIVGRLYGDVYGVLLMIRYILIGTSFLGLYVDDVRSYATQDFVGTADLRAGGAILGSVYSASTISTTSFIRFLGRFGTISDLTIGLYKGALFGYGDCVFYLVKDLLE